MIVVSDLSDTNCYSASKNFFYPRDCNNSMCSPKISMRECIHHYHLVSVKHAWLPSDVDLHNHRTVYVFK